MTKKQSTPPCTHVGMEQQRHRRCVSSIVHLAVHALPKIARRQRGVEPVLLARPRTSAPSTPQGRELRDKVALAFVFESSESSAVVIVTHALAWNVPLTPTLWEGWLSRPLHLEGICFEERPAGVGRGRGGCSVDVGLSAPALISRLPVARAAPDLG